MIKAVSPNCSETCFCALRVAALALTLLVSSGCAVFIEPIFAPAPATLNAALPPVRFMLTFDDGPSGGETNNPTEIILDALADNPTQKGIKAIFFLQTRSSDGGLTARGRALILREQAVGHVLALHDGSPWGHRSHRNLNDRELEQSLRDGVADLNPVRGRAVTLVRPPYWAFDARTLAAYARYDLAVVLTDISANDGKDWGFKASPRRFIHMASEMRKVRARIERGEIGVVDGVIPIIVTFHDTNTYTAAHMQEYVQMIVDKARAAGLTPAAQPFYAEPLGLERAALIRASDLKGRAAMVPWWWRWIQW